MVFSHLKSGGEWTVGYTNQSERREVWAGVWDLEQRGHLKPPDWWKTSSVERKQKWFRTWILGHHTLGLRGPGNEEPMASEEKRPVEPDNTVRGRRVKKVSDFLLILPLPQGQPSV